MKPASCSVCGQEFEAGEQRVAWFAADAQANVTDRGAVHLRHLVGDGEP